jgi:hypothetical protein
MRFGKEPSLTLLLAAIEPPKARQEQATHLGRFMFTHRSNKNGYTTPQINLVNREVLDLFAGKTDLDTTLKTLWSESLQLHHLLAGIFRVSFSEPSQNPGSRLFVEGSSAKAAENFSKLLERSDTQKKATSFLWDKVRIRSKDWFTLLVAQLSPAARLQLITYVPSGIDLERTGLHLHTQVAEYMATEDRPHLIALATQQKKLARLYGITGWEECRALANDPDRASLLEIDMGI